MLADGTPLCQLPGLAARPHAYPKLWKHHAAQPQADRINATAHERHEKWISRYGGKISSEWQFAKALQLLDEDYELYQRADRWIEAADWIIWQLCGTETRNACTAGYKGIYQDGQYPSREFLAALDPRFAGFAADKLAAPDLGAGRPGRPLTPAAAAMCGLPDGIAVAVGNVDAHVTVPAAGPVAAGKMVAIMGTSTCHVMNGAELAEVPGMCGVVDGGIVAGLWGYEAGQSGVGDIFAWFARNGVPGEFAEEARRRGMPLQQLLDEKATAAPPGAHGLVALDWAGGNRSVLVDGRLSGAIVGLTLATTAPEIYRALLESTAFGTRMIIDTFGMSGVPVTELVVAGGLVKSAPLMQIYADVTRRPLSVIGSEQGPALGSAIHAAVAAGAYPDVPAAAAAMGRIERDVYRPDPASADVYDELYAEYVRLHDYFGRGRATRSCTGCGPSATGCWSGRGREASAAPMSAWPSSTRCCAALRGDGRARCTPSWCATAWSPGRRATCPPGRRTDLMVIKPSGVAYADLTPCPWCVCDLDGTPVGGGLSPSSDTATHAYIYRHMPAGRRRGAHPLRYATAWAARGEADPVRDHRHGRRVRRRDPGRAVRADRQRRDRPGGGRPR